MLVLGKVIRLNTFFPPTSLSLNTLHLHAWNVCLFLNAFCERQILVKHIFNWFQMRDRQESSIFLKAPPPSLVGGLCCGDNWDRVILVKTWTNSDRGCITTEIDVQQILMDLNQNRIWLCRCSWRQPGLFYWWYQLYLMIKHANLLVFLSGPTERLWVS